MSLFAVDGLRKEFGGLVALDGASFGVEEGELVGMIGPNGAGKTTLFNCVSGVLESDGGSVTFGGEDVTNAHPHGLARRGLVRTYQQARELSTMTVEDNILLPAPEHPGERIWHAVLRTDASQVREDEAHERAHELLEFARALMLDPSLLLLDEPFAGVNPALTDQITDYVQRLNDDGMTFLIIEHDIGTLADLVDRIIVLSDGDVLTSGAPEVVLSDERVIDTYLGGEMEA